MKIINIMNFVRQCDPRMENSERILYETTAAEVALVKEYGLAGAGYWQLMRFFRDNWLLLN